MRPTRRRAIALVLSVAALAALAAVAASAQQPTQVPIKLRVEAKVTPNRAGTPRKPQGVRIGVVAHIDIPSDYDPPLVEKVEVWFPRGGVYNGHRYPSCSQATLDRRGPSACPKGAIMGSGRGTATADRVPTYPRITVVNGGRDRAYFYTVMTNPARVQAPVVGKVRKLGGRWSYHLSATIPKNLQIVAGVPIVLNKLEINAGRGSWLATTSCPSNRRWPYKARVTFDDGQVLDYADSVPCRPARRR
jgi:hypothetical protein